MQKGEESEEKGTSHSLIHNVLDISYMVYYLNLASAFLLFGVFD